MPAFSCGCECWILLGAFVGNLFKTRYVEDVLVFVDRFLAESAGQFGNTAADRDIGSVQTQAFLRVVDISRAAGREDHFVRLVVRIVGSGLRKRADDRDRFADIVIRIGQHGRYVNGVGEASDGVDACAAGILLFELDGLEESAVDESWELSCAAS